ncbi:MAG: hypothetical protein HYX69_13285 [Planctomycetia bacterium]|nr:hypothetical protein [Planctomycetia bacterium]
MSILTLLSPWRAGRLKDELAQQVARRAYVALREVCEDRVPAMTHAEARGYLWAKARPLVAAEVTHIAQFEPALPIAFQAQLAQRSRERLVRLVMTDLMRDRVRSTSRRRAA